MSLQESKPETVQVFDVDTEEIREVTRAEAAAGLIRVARSLGPGTPACGLFERRALELLADESR